MKLPCYRPLTAYRDSDGSIVFVTEHPLPKLQLPCGQCVGCRIEKSREWALRCVHEASCHDANAFLTLTYSPERLPPDCGLHKEDFQKFARRLRKNVGPFRYFHCGEYGDKSLRPHYHALIFGMDFRSGSVVARHTDYGELRVNEALNRLWGHGSVWIGNVTFQSAAYVARYIMKKVKVGMDSEEFIADRYTRYDSVTGECWTVNPEYVTMSRRPGIGSMWYDKYNREVRASDECIHDGMRFKVPKYYSAKFPEDELLTVKAKRIERMKARASELTPERLREREAVQSARASKLVRSSI